MSVIKRKTGKVKYEKWNMPLAIDCRFIHACYACQYDKRKKQLRIRMMCVSTNKLIKVAMRVKKTFWKFSFYFNKQIIHHVHWIVTYKHNWVSSASHRIVPLFVWMAFSYLVESNALLMTQLEQFLFDSLLLEKINFKALSFQRNHALAPREARKLVWLLWIIESGKDIS